MLKYSHFTENVGRTGSFSLFWWKPFMLKPNFLMNYKRYSIATLKNRTEDCSTNSKESSDYFKLHNIKEDLNKISGHFNDFGLSQLPLFETKQNSND